MIEVKNLTKRYGSNLAVDDISFSVKKGEIVGFLGPNGAGKTTTMNILTGYLSATAGEVKIGEYDVLENPLKAKAQIGYLPEFPPLYPDMTVEEYLNFIYDLKKVKYPRKMHIEEICKMVKIDDVYTRMIRNLSKGYKQRVGFAQALLGNPQVLILDEPTVGLDPNQIIEIRSLIKRLGRNHTVILSSHILSEIQAVCERIIIINKGKIIADNTPEGLSNQLSNDNRLSLLIEADEVEVLENLRNMEHISQVTPLGMKGNNLFEYDVKMNEGCDVRRDIFNLALDKGWVILEMHYHGMTLEDVFIRLTNSNQTDIADKAGEAQ